VTEDWVLVYKITKFQLFLIRTGSHQMIFYKRK
jgi:mRNA-degrading endonuclease YafQ of YafQ-DinJ toxin-antitoxin module